MLYIRSRGTEFVLLILFLVATPGFYGPLPPTDCSNALLYHDVSEENRFYA